MSQHAVAQKAAAARSEPPCVVARLVDVIGRVFLILSMRVTSPNRMTAQGVPAGGYYFSVTAYDTAGNESGYSAAGTKTDLAGNPCAVSPRTESLSFA